MYQIPHTSDVYRPGGWADNIAILLQPSLGDIIDFNRGAYSHHGIYVGNNNVVHKVGKNTSSKATIQLESLKSVARGCLMRINNHEVGARDRGLSARTPGNIVALATAEVGNEEMYHYLNQNCEEFVTRLRYGVGWSAQAELLVPGSSAVATPGQRLHFR